MHSRNRFIFATLSGLVISPAVWADGEQGSAQIPAPSHVLQLRAETVDPGLYPNLLTHGSLPSTGKAYVVQLDGPMTPTRRAALEASGIELDQYLPRHAYVTQLDAAALRTMQRLEFVRWVGEYQRAWKLDPNLGKRELVTADRRQLQANGKLDLQVALFPWADLETAVAEMKLLGADVPATHITGKRSIAHVIVNEASASSLADLDAVQFIEESPEVVARNDTNEWIVQSNVSGSTPVWDQGIQGEGQIGAQIDWPLNTNHCSFFDTEPIGPTHRKVVAYRGASGSDTHGTHVCGSFVGDSGTWGVEDFRDGIALAAKVSFANVLDLYADPGLLITRFGEAYDDGARVHTNSWGDDGTTAYTTWCEQIDAYSRDHEDALVVFAVTNLSTLKTPENAKNVLACGATSDTPNQANHCKGGTGPTIDGRRKPEIFAPGCGTQSSSQSTSCSWTSFTGTSMSAPVISGSGLLVRQYFVDGFYPTGMADEADSFVPSGALIKATLINAAVDMTGVTGYPSDKEGWGRLLLDGSLYFAGEDRTLVAKDIRNAEGMSTGESLSYTLEVLDSTEPLRVTLVWTDVPASVGATFAPINNLDLIVAAPDGSVYLGNNITSGQSQVGGVADEVNNLEQVHLLTPAVGQYQVTVQATEVNQETQGFALAATGSVIEVVTACDGDVNGDGLVDPLDSGYVLSRLGCPVHAGDPLCDAADANADSIVDPLDVGYVLSRLGTCL